MAIAAAVVAVLIAPGLAAHAASFPGANPQPAAAPQPSAEPGFPLWERVLERNQNLGAYRAAVSMKFRESSFPWLGAGFGGTVYFESPGRFAATFTNVPALLRQFPGAYDDMMDFAAWPSWFAFTKGPPRVDQGHHDISWHLTALNAKSPLQSGWIYVNPANATIDEMDWDLGSMQFDVTQTFEPFGLDLVLAEQQATIRVPIARAGATVAFGDYRARVAFLPPVSPKTR
ncbi:MAG: hypothetical protein ACREM2_12065 [Vulcanimicrobiaceae bacterium]